MHCKWKYFYLDIGVRGSTQVQRWQFCALDCSHVQRLGIEIVLQLQTTKSGGLHISIFRLPLNTSCPQDGDWCPRLQITLGLHYIIISRYGTT